MAEKFVSETGMAPEGGFVQPVNPRHSISVDPQAINEKNHPLDSPHAVEVVDDFKAEVDVNHLDPYVPFPIDPNAPEEGNILTVRAIFLGACLGALVNASNLYLGKYSPFPTDRTIAYI